MANWQRRIFLNPEWEQAQEGDVTLQALAGVVAARLKECAPFDVAEYECADNARWANDKRAEIVAEFESMAGDADLDRDEFNFLMEELYDWGDTPLSTGFHQAKRVCFVDWMSPRPALVPSPT